MGLHHALAMILLDVRKCLTGEITERSRRQLEITGRLAELERCMGMRGIFPSRRQAPTLGPPPWMARWETHEKVREKVRDLEAKVTAQQLAIDNVWALVELTDGYGSPFWAEPALDDTTPAKAVGAVLEHLRAKADQLAEQATGRHRARGYTEELTEALGYLPGSITWQRALELVLELVHVHVKLDRLEKLRLDAADRQSEDDQICGS